MKPIDDYQPPLLVEDFLTSFRAGVVRVGMFSSVAPHGTTDAVDEVKTCVVRVAMPLAAAIALRDNLSEIVQMAQTLEAEGPPN